MNTIDLTSHIERAKRHSSGWSPERAKAVAAALAGCISSGKIDWDRLAGESWIRVLAGNSVAALIFVSMPMSFVLESFVPYFLTALSLENVHLVEVSGWDKKEFSGNREKILALTGHQQWSEAVDPNAFSANEFWWMTV